MDRSTADKVSGIDKIASGPSHSSGKYFCINFGTPLDDPSSGARVCDFTLGICASQILLNKSERRPRCTRTSTWATNQVELFDRSRIFPDSLHSAQVSTKARILLGERALSSSYFSISQNYPATLKQHCEDNRQTNMSSHDFPPALHLADCNMEALPWVKSLKR